MRWVLGSVWSRFDSSRRRLGGRSCRRLTGWLGGAGLGFVGCGAAALRRGEPGGPPVNTVAGEWVVRLEQLYRRRVAEQGDLR